MMSLSHFKKNAAHMTRWRSSAIIPAPGWMTRPPSLGRPLAPRGIFFCKYTTFWGRALVARLEFRPQNPYSLGPRSPSLATPPGPKPRTDVLLWGRPATSAVLASAPSGPILRRAQNVFWGRFVATRTSASSVESSAAATPKVVGKRWVCYTCEVAFWICPVLGGPQNNELAAWFSRGANSNRGLNAVTI
jgi:hypothetical protein